MFDRLSSYAPQALAILRVVTALLFIEHGTQKLLGFPVPAQTMPGMETMMLVAGLLELIGGLLILVGFFTRPAAFILCGMMAVAYWMFHAPAGFHPILNQGELAILYSFVFLYVAAAGAGAFSLDNIRARPIANSRQERVHA